MQLILDKNRMPSVLPRLSRQRLLTLLDESLAACAATILNGRAATGKTLLAADFARRCGRDVAWFNVDASDSEMSQFFRYLVEAVRAARPAFGGSTLLPLLETATVEETPVLAEAFVYELHESGGAPVQPGRGVPIGTAVAPLLIVIEDLHHVYDAEWVAPFFRRLLPLIPPDTHILITGRSLPPAPLWRMRSKQTLCVVGEEELAFTADETRRLLAEYGLTLEQAGAVQQLTHGRAGAVDALATLLRSESPRTTTTRRPRRPLPRQGQASAGRR